MLLVLKYSFIKYTQVKHKLALYERTFTELNDLSIEGALNVYSYKVSTLEPREACFGV